MIIRISVATAALLLLCNNAAAQMSLEAPPEKASPYSRPLTAIDAYELVRRNWQRVLFVDVRTTAEAALLGTPRLADANVPFLRHTHPVSWDETTAALALEPNDRFVALARQRLLEKRLTLADAVVLICADGKRSAQAAEALAAAGFAQIYSVIDGFEGDQVEADTPSGRRHVNGWKLSGLPWIHPTDRQYFGLPSGEAVP